MNHAPDPDTLVSTFANGVRVVAIRLPHPGSASVAVFVRSGSQHESRRRNGIGHFIEHMAFKGTATRDCQRINLDAERLGAEVNAHTDKDHTAYWMRGLPRDAEAFVGMLADIVQHSSFPPEELERERQVILHEFVDDEEDALSTAYKLFDAACYGDHAVARPVIGQRRNIEHFTRDDLVEHVREHYSGCNLVVGVAGDVDPQRIAAAAEAAFGALPRGSDNLVEPPVWHGGLRSRRMAGSSQTHVVLGYPIAPLTREDPASVVAAALFGEGMSSPLLDEVRERRGLAYHAACSADVLELSGEFVVEASTASEQLDEFFVEVMRLLRAQADATDAVALERARNQLAVRSLRTQERPLRRLEAAALDLFALGRVRSRAEWMRGIDAVGADEVREAFRRLLAQPASVALTGKVGKGVPERVAARVGTHVLAR